MTSKVTLEDIIERVVIDKNDCWNWQGAKIKGYGSIRVNMKHFYVHRLTWILTNGEISDGLYACHKCDNPACCNPRHIFLGTQRENMIDSSKKGRHWKANRKFCDKGHEFNEENTYLFRGNKQCKVCNNIASRKYRKTEKYIKSRDDRKIKNK